MAHHDRAITFGKALLLMLFTGLVLSFVAGNPLPFAVTAVSEFFGLVFFNALESHIGD